MMELSIKIIPGSYHFNEINERSNLPVSTLWGLERQGLHLQRLISEIQTTSLMTKLTVSIYVSQIELTWVGKK